MEIVRTIVRTKLGDFLLSHRSQHHRILNIVHLAEQGEHGSFDVFVWYIVELDGYLRQTRKGKTVRKGGIRFREAVIGIRVWEKGRCVRLCVGV